MTEKSRRDFKGSPDRFGYEWDNYDQILPEYEEQFRGWTAHFSPDDWRGRRFLDVGCGMGRNSYWPMKYGARAGVAIDVDDRSLASARRNLSPFPTMQVLKLSAYDIAYESDFDIAFSIGVIHHLEFPDQALARMVRAVKPGGRVLIWVYGFENNRILVNILNPLRNWVLSRLPIDVVHHLSLYPAALLWVLLKFGWRPTDYFRLIARFDFRHLRSIVFDQMLPRIAHYWSRETVIDLMKGAGLDDLCIAWVNQISWSAVGTRPAQR